MPTKRYKITNNKTGETRSIDWDGEAPPTSDDVKNYFDRVKTPNPTNQDKPYEKVSGWYDTVKGLASKGYHSVMDSMAPEVNVDTRPKTLDEAEYKTSHPITSFATDALLEGAGQLYNKGIRPAMSPFGGVTAMMGGSELAGMPGADTARRVMFGGLAAKGGYDAIDPVKKAFTNPNVDNLSDATLAVASPILMGAGAAAKGKVASKLEPVEEGTSTSLVKGNATERPEEFTAVGDEQPAGRTKFTDPTQIAYDNMLAKKGGKLKEGETVDLNKANGETGLVKPETLPKKYETVGPPNPPEGNNGETVNPNDPKQVTGRTQRNYGEFPDEFADYVNARKASKLEGDYTGKKFTYLDQDVREGDTPATFDQLDDNHPLNLLQQNLKEGNFPEVRQHLDNIHKDLNNAGVDTQYKQDYLPQIWDNTPEQISNALGKRLGLKPSFTFESLFKDYQQGIEAGLTPKFDKPSELLDYYTSYARKAIADKQFFDYLKDTGKIQENKIGSDWKALSPDYFPKNLYDKTYYAEPNVARVLNNYFANPAEGSWGDIGLNQAAELSGKATRTVLGFHLPGTAWSVHGVNTGISHTLFGEDLSPLKAAGRLGESAYYLSKPEAGEAFLNNNPVSAVNAVRDGGLAIDKWSSDIGKPLISGDSIAAKGLNFLTNPKPLFQQVIPTLMLKAYERQVTELQRQGIDYKTAAKRAGADTNNTFGVLNREQSTNPLVADKTVNNIKRTFLLAPNWLESRYNLAKGTGQALLDPTNPLGKKYLSGVSNFLATYAALNVMNMIVNDGKSMLQNEPGKELSLAVGKDSKSKTIYINPYAGAIDFVKVPLDIAHAALGENLGEASKDARSRLSEPAQLAVDLLSNTDWKGSPLLGTKGNYGKYQSLGTQLGNTASDVAGHFSPIPMEAGIQLGQGKISPEEAAARLLQLPISFKGESKIKPRSRYAPVGPRIPSAP